MTITYKIENETIVAEMPNDYALAERIVEYLLDGMTHKIRTLAAHQSVLPRRVYEAVRTLREAGHPIIGDERGIRLARTRSEIYAFADSIKRKMQADIRSMHALRLSMLRICGEQPSLFDSKIITAIDTK